MTATTTMRRKQSLDSCAAPNQPESQTMPEQFVDEDRSKETMGLERRQVPKDKLRWGIATLSTWIVIFAAGLLIETEDYRHALAPRSVSLTPIVAPAAKDNGTPATASQEVKAGSLRRVMYSGWSYVAALVCFTPLNLFFLALASGLAGGFASNIAIETMPEHRRHALAAQHPTRSMLLQEPPISAAFRGFIVYLCVIAGLYIVLDNPFKDPSPNQYIRLAGTLSIMAFLVGYDASRIEDWLRAIPSPGRASDASRAPTIPETQRQARIKEEQAEKALER
jgi:hypothetical protein